MSELIALAEEFYARPVTDLAQGLLGRILAHLGPDGETAGGIIVETEAYLAQGDPGCHAARGKTRRNTSMFGPFGTSYVHLVYGVHCCLNVVAGPPGVPEAVLIRALEPTMGVPTMLRRRGVTRLEDCCNGPGKLCQAMGIGLEHNETDLTTPPLFIADPPGGRQSVEPSAIVTATRIGLRAGMGDDLPLRYYIKGSQYVSRE